MIRSWKYVAVAAALIAATMSMSACKEKGPMEKAGAKIDDAASSAKDAVGDAVDKAGEAIEEAGDEIREKTDH